MKDDLTNQRTEHRSGYVDRQSSSQEEQCVTLQGSLVLDPWSCKCLWEQEDGRGCVELGRTAWVGAPPRLDGPGASEGCPGGACARCVADWCSSCAGNSQPMFTMLGGSAAAHIQNGWNKSTSDISSNHSVHISARSLHVVVSSFSPAPQPTI